MSYYARTQIKNYLTTNIPSENFIDLTAAYQEVGQLLSDNDLPPDSSFIGIDFQDGEINPIALAATETTGLYREIGTFQLHIAQIARMGVSDNIPQRADALIKLFNLAAKRFGDNNDIVIDHIFGLRTGIGATLDFESGYVAGTINVSYYRDITDPRNF